jgi:hypothetical protein
MSLSPAERYLPARDASKMLSIAEASAALNSLSLC